MVCFLLAHSERGEENGNKAVLPPGNAILRMTRYLEEEMTISPSVK
jgi:hypothetical protein